MSDPTMDERLAESLRAFASQTTASPDAYARAKQEWQRRDRRRRLVMVAVAGVLIAAADVVGLWALHASEQSTTPTPSSSTPAAVSRVVILP
jgi:hypothetical protein